MASDRIQRRIERLLDLAEQAADREDWDGAARRAREVLAFDSENEDALALLAVAGAMTTSPPPPTAQGEGASDAASSSTPDSFADGRYEVLRFLGEGGKKRVFLAHDQLLDRDVAFSLIKTEGLDDVGRERIMREAQAMGRLTHPHIVSVFDMGEHEGQPYLVQELMGGGDVEGLLEGHEGGLPLPDVLRLAVEVCRGLEYAHAQGVVHRDLKPGNVWLTTDGTAKIGDLGLAVVSGRSRLTQHGIMVGTFGYMPPEQALGSEVTPQADLYSLGAMLYELVTGRPPFEGDTPTAVISQHVNTAPVAPSYRSDHCPPDLEALILGLLAKAPEARPPSATEVREALERVDAEGRSASHSDTSASPLDRLARGVFVGRELELERLRNAFDEAFAGRGSVVMLVGEPGIGKTRTTQELETYARMRGGRVIWGRAHEASGAPVYRPWVQAADTYNSVWGLEGIAQQLAVEDTSELSRIFPLLRQQPNYVPPPEIVDPTAARFRLFEAYTRLLRAFATEAPIVVVLDDLHWADKATLLLLQHVARELTRLRLLIVGTYRDTELARTHPLSEALAELNREAGLQRVSLRGLSVNAVGRYIRGTAGVEPSRALVERVHEETEGNPFFLHEVVNLMTEEGTITSDSVSEIAIPEGVREALGRRLDRLSEDANTLLQYAAVAGRQFAYDTLKLVTEHDDDALLRLIEEGLAARVIEETAQAGRYQFTHALMQETLVEELSTTRRVRMHGEIGEAIEKRYGDRAGEQATRLAVHFLESASLRPEHLEVAAKYCTIAASQAKEGAAWSEAARHLGSVIALVDERAVSLDVDLGAVLIDYGRAKRIEGDPRPGWRALLRARELCRESGDVARFAMATTEMLSFLGAPDRLVALADEALEFLGDGSSASRARLLGLRASIIARSPRFSNDEAHSATHEAEAAVDAEGSLAHAALLEARGHLGARAADLEQGANFTGAFDSYDRLGESESAAFALLFWNRLLTNMGQLDDALKVAREGADYCRRSGATTPLRGFLLAIASILAARDDPEVDSVLDEQAGLFGDYYGRQVQARRLAWSGRLDEALEIAPPPEVDPRPMIQDGLACARARIAYLRGDEAPLRAVLARWGDPGISALNLDDALVATGSEDQLADAYRSLTGDEAQEGGTEDAPRARFSWGGSSFDRLRGDLALRLGLDEAKRHFQLGLEWCERERCPIEAGRCHQGLAELAEREGRHVEALEHLDAAGELFSRHGVKLYLNQVIAKKEILKA